MKLTQRKMRSSLALLSGSLLLGAYHFGGPAAAGARASSNLIRVTDKLSILPNPRAGNIGLFLGQDGLLMIDDQFFDDVKNTEAAIAELKGPAPLYLINTHWHGDHTGANAHFGKTATIFAHGNVRERLAADAGLKGRPALPEVTYEKGLSIHFNGEELRLVHVPRAHTDGDTIVWFQDANVIHMGDLFFASGYPFIDVSSGGNALGLVAGLRSLLDWLPEDAQVIPGHGALTDVAALESYTSMLETIIERVRELRAEDYGLEELMAAGVSEEYDAAWGTGFIKPRRLLESILASLPK